MARVNGDVSDLFFNRDLSHTKLYESGDFVGYDEAKLWDEAADFAASIERISGLDYSPNEIVADFYARI